jgi:hypothetical protein
MPERIESVEPNPEELTDNERRISLMFRELANLMVESINLPEEEKVQRLGQMCYLVDQM